MKSQGNAITDSARTDFRWEPIICFYCLYICVIVIGDLLGIHGASSVGAALFLVCLYGLYFRFLSNLKLNIMLLCMILCIVLPVIPAVSLDAKIMGMAYQELIKYYALNFVIILGLSLPLTPLARSKRAKLLYFVILAFLILGWLLTPVKVSSYDMLKPVMGVKGFLANSNNFALTAMMLLLLVDEERSKGFWWFNVVVVLFLVYHSHTSGALLGFLVGMIYRFIYGKGKGRIWVRAAAVVVSLGLVVIIYVSIPPNTFEPVDATTAKIKVMYDNIDRVFSNRPIDFYGIIEKSGRNVTSGVWRIYHWNHILRTFWNSSIEEIFFGHGIGTIDSVFGIEAHNDYLRFLFQTGMVGLLLNLFVWGMLFRRMEMKYRWIIVMIAAYCLSENNYDNFLAMSLLALYVIGSGRRKQYADSPAGPEHDAVYCGSPETLTETSSVF